MSSPLLGVLVLLGACHHETASGGPPPPGSSGGLGAQLQALAQRMHARYGGAQRLEEAIARSDLPRAHTEAHTVSLLDEPDVLPTWRPYFEAVAETARQLETSGDITAAAKLFGTLGVRCAHCHDASGARLVLPPPSVLAAGSATMAEHQKAALEMWEGLMAPSDVHWRAGALALTTVPLTMVAQAVTPSSEQDVDDVAKVRLYARRALDAGDHEARAEVFGSLLATCAHCHALLRDR